MGIDITVPTDATHPKKEWALVNDDEGVYFERVVAPDRRRRWHISATKGVEGGRVEVTTIISSSGNRPTRIRRKTYEFTEDTKLKVRTIGGARVKSF